MTADPIKVFVGCCAGGEDAEAQMVTEYSIRKNTNRDVEFVWMKQSKDPKDFWNVVSPNGWRTETWPTPFSAYRWGIPAACNYEGQAIYMDSDMIILSDLGDLWDQPFEKGKVVMAKAGNQGWRYCVCKWDCAAAKDHLPLIETLKTTPTSHQQMMAYYSNHQNIVQKWEGDWNNIDMESNENFDDIDILHYSSMNHQPCTAYALKRLEEHGNKAHWFDGEVKTHWRQEVIDLFAQYYNEALENGYDVENYTDYDFGPYIKESQANYGKHGGMHPWVK